jgi:hypothetical protein
LGIAEDSCPAIPPASLPETDAVFLQEIIFPLHLAAIPPTTPVPRTLPEKEQLVITPLCEPHIPPAA